MNKALFSIQSEYLNTIEELEQYLIDNNTDEVPESFLERLSINKDEVEEKLNNYRLAINTITSDVITIKLEEKRLKEIRDRKESTIVYLKKRVFNAVELYGKDTNKNNGKRIETAKTNVSLIRINNLVIDDVEKLDHDCLDVELKNISYEDFIVITTALHEVQQYACVQILDNAIKSKIANKKKVLEAIEFHEIAQANRHDREQFAYEGAHIDTTAGYIKFT